MRSSSNSEINLQLNKGKLNKIVIFVGIFWRDSRLFRFHSCICQTQHVEEKNNNISATQKTVHK